MVISTHPEHHYTFLKSKDKFRMAQSSQDYSKFFSGVEVLSSVMHWAPLGTLHAVKAVYLSSFQVKV